MWISEISIKNGALVPNRKAQPVLLAIGLRRQVRLFIEVPVSPK